MSARTRDGLFLALQIHPEDAATIASFVASHGIKPIAPEDMHVTLLRLNRGTLDLTAFPDLPADARAATLGYGLYSRAEHRIHRAAFLTLERATIEDLRRELLLGYGGDKNPFPASPGVLKPSFRQMVKPPHLTLTFHPSERLVKEPFPLPEVRLGSVIANVPDLLWHRRHL